MKKVSAQSTPQPLGLSCFVVLHLILFERKTQSPPKRTSKNHFQNNFLVISPGTYWDPLNDLKTLPFFLTIPNST